MNTLSTVRIDADTYGNGRSRKAVLFTCRGNLYWWRKYPIATRLRMIRALWLQSAFLARGGVLQ